MTPRDLAALFEELELQLIASLKRNMTRHRKQEQDEGGKNDVPEHWEAWQSAKLRDIHRFRRENQEILGEYAPKIDAETEAMLRQQYAEGGADGFFHTSDDKLRALLEEMRSNEGRVEKAALRYMDDVYRKTVLRSAVALNAGGVTLQQAVDGATQDFLAQGINCVEYANGRLVNIASYAEMALRTCSTRAMLLGEARQRDRLGINTVLVSQYGACSDTCLPWQGKVYIDDVFQEYTGPRGGSFGVAWDGHQYLFLSIAIKAGLFHPNCRHTLTTWIRGVSTLPKPMDARKIERVNKLEKRQRALERRVRQAKRQAAGLTDPEAQKEAQRRVRKRQKDLREFVNDNGDILRRDPWRERYDETPYQGRSDYGRNDHEQYLRYADRLGCEMPDGGYIEFLRIKQVGGTEWARLQEKYRYTGIIDRLLKKNSSAVVCDKPEDIPEDYQNAARGLSQMQKEGLYHYSHYREGVRMNMSLGGVQSVELSVDEQRNLRNTVDALNHMRLPHDTILWRGTEPKLLKGFEGLNPKDLRSWKGYALHMDGFTSTSILKSTSYNTKPVQMVILAPGNAVGAGYIEEVSYNAAYVGVKEGDWILQREYEVLLQKGARFDIIEAQKFNDKTILVVRWVPDEA